MCEANAYILKSAEGEKMEKRILFAIISMMFLIVTGLQPVLAASNIELEERIEALEKGSLSGSRVPGQISDRFTLSGTIELDYAYAGDSDLSDNTNNQSSSDLDIGTVELGLEAALHEYVTANLLLKGEALDSDDKIFWDEVFFTISDLLVEIPPSSWHMISLDQFL